MNLLDALLQPIEEGRITIARALRTVCFPAEVQLVAATNPCPCGFEGDRTVSCRCRPSSQDLGDDWRMVGACRLRRPAHRMVPPQPGRFHRGGERGRARCPVRVECRGRSTKTMGFGEARPNCSGNGSGGRTAPESRRRGEGAVEHHPDCPTPADDEFEPTGQARDSAWYGPRRASPRRTAREPVPDERSLPCRRLNPTGPG